ncbi:MAG: class I SAM-dependent methyltransferase [Pseudomonadota bacterium]
MHATGFAGQWDGAADWLAELANRTSHPPFVVDVGCGDGRMLAKLRDHGVPGCGFDISESFVQAARERGLDASVADAVKLNVPLATLVIAVGEVLAYRNAAGEVALENVIAAAAKALLPGGSLVFDVTSTEVVAGASWLDGGNWFVASRNRIVDDANLTREITVFFKQGDTWRRSDEVHHQQLFDTGKVAQRLREAGLTVRPLSSIGDVELLPGRAAFLATKPG